MISPYISPHLLARREDDQAELAPSALARRLVDVRVDVRVRIRVGVRVRNRARVRVRVRARVRVRDRLGLAPR